MNKISYVGKSDIGKLRTNNEDANIAQNIWDDNHVLGVAIDGVGGYEGGERAAEIAKETIVDYLMKHQNGERLDLLKSAVVEANNKIEDERQTKKQFPNMSCVLTACIVEVDKKRINMVHVGDTRLYQYYGNALLKLSHDHSLIGYREEIGNLTEEEAMNHPERNLINRLVGETFHHLDDKDFIEAATFPLLPNSTLLLCSDGLCDMLTSSEMLSVLKQNISLKDKVKELIRLANDKGGKDNITVILIDYPDDDSENKNESLSIKSVNESENYNKSIVKSVKEIETQRPAHSDKKAGCFSRSLLWALLGIIIGLAGGWFGYEKFLFKEEPIQVLNLSLSDLPVIVKDTVLLKNDSCTIRVIGEKLQKDTIIP